MLARLLQPLTAMTKGPWLAGLLGQSPADGDGHSNPDSANRGRRKTDSADAQDIAPVDGRTLQEVVAQLRRGFTIVGIFSFFINLLVLTSPLYMLQIFDRVLTGGRYSPLSFFHPLRLDYSTLSICGKAAIRY